MMPGHQPPTHRVAEQIGAGPKGSKDLEERIRFDGGIREAVPWRVDEPNPAIDRGEQPYQWVYQRIAVLGEAMERDQDSAGSVGVDPQGGYLVLEENLCRKKMGNTNTSDRT